MKLTQDRTRKVSAKDAELQQKASELLTQEIRFIYSPDFDSLVDDEHPIELAQQLLQELSNVSNENRAKLDFAASMNSDEVAAVRNWCAPDPLLTFENEQVLFRAMNLLRFRINQQRARLSAKKPIARTIERIEKMLALVEKIRTQLVNSNLRLVSSIARKFSTSGCDVDEFSSDGCMILLGAIDRFDYSRGFRFSTYATHSIQRHFFRAWKLRQRRKERFSCLPPELLTEFPEEEPEQSICADPEAVVAELLAKADGVLDDREQQILMNRYGLGASTKARTLREIASDLGISKERVRQLQMKALERLKELLEPENSSGDSVFAIC